MSDLVAQRRGHLLAQHFVKRRGFRHTQAVGSGFWDTIKSVAKKAGKAIKEQVTNQDSFLRSKLLPLAEQHISKIAPILDRISPNLASKVEAGIAKANQYNETAKAMGYGRVGGGLIGGSYKDGCKIAKHCIKLHGLSHSAHIGMGFWDSLKNIAKKAGEAIKNQVTDPNSFLRSKALPFVAEHVGKVADYVPFGSVLKTGVNLAQKANQVATANGYGRIGGGYGDFSKAKARGALISKLMKEHKITLPEASKYIKDQKLTY